MRLMSIAYSDRDRPDAPLTGSMQRRADPDAAVERLAPGDPALIIATPAAGAGRSHDATAATG
jgi:hypothetical protein